MHAKRFRTAIAVAVAFVALFSNGVVRSEAGRMPWPIPLEEATPTRGFSSRHKALDISAPLGTPIRASGPGRVISSSLPGWNGGRGNFVEVAYDNGLVFSYNHLERVSVKRVGQRVDKTSVLGTVGNTGRVRGPTGMHLHLTVKTNGDWLNPLAILEEREVKMTAKVKRAISKAPDMVAARIPSHRKLRLPGPDFVEPPPVETARLFRKIPHDEIDAVALEFLERHDRTSAGEAPLILKEDPSIQELLAALDEIEKPRAFSPPPDGAAELNELVQAIEMVEGRVGQLEKSVKAFDRRLSAFERDPN